MSLPRTDVQQGLSHCMVSLPSDLKRLLVAAAQSRVPMWA